MSTKKKNFATIELSERETLLWDSNEHPANTKGSTPGYTKPRDPLAPWQAPDLPGPCADDNTKVRRLDRRAQAAACTARRRWRTKTTHTRWPLGAMVRPVDLAASCVLLLAELRSRLAGVGPRYAALRSFAEDLTACGVLRDLADLAAQVDQSARADLDAIEGGA